MKPDKEIKQDAEMLHHAMNISDNRWNKLTSRVSEKAKDGATKATILNIIVDISENTDEIATLCFAFGYRTCLEEIKDRMLVMME